MKSEIFMDVVLLIGGSGHDKLIRHRLYAPNWSRKVHDISVCHGLDAPDCATKCAQSVRKCYDKPGFLGVIDLASVCHRLSVGLS